MPIFVNVNIISEKRKTPWLYSRLFLTLVFFFFLQKHYAEQVTGERERMIRRQTKTHNYTAGMRVIYFQQLICYFFSYIYILSSHWLCAVCIQHTYFNSRETVNLFFLLCCFFSQKWKLMSCGVYNYLWYIL